MIDAARRHSIILQEAVMMRYHPQTRLVQQRVAEGAIGDVRLIRGVFTFTLDRPGDIRFDASLGGGSIWDLGSYPVSFMRAMMRAEPEDAHGWRTNGPTEVDASFAGHLRFACGAVTQFFSSFQAAPYAHVDVLGSAGRMELDLPFVNKVGVSSHVRICRASHGPASGTFSDTAGKIDEELVTYDNVNAYQNEIEAMVASILDGADPVVPLIDSRGNVATLEALCASAKTGVAVRLA
jgi:predicted dehydrogenase